MTLSLFMPQCICKKSLQSRAQDKPGTSLQSVLLVCWKGFVATALQQAVGLDSSNGSQ